MSNITPSLFKGSFKCMVNVLEMFIVFISLFTLGCGNETLQSPMHSSKGSNNEKLSQKSSNNVDVVKTPEDGSGKRDDTYRYRADGRRDPFKSLLIDMKGKKPALLTPLQQWSLGELRVIGIVWGTQDYMAMIETPDGKGFLIKEGTLVGPEGGIVKKITEDSVVVEEIYTDYYGRKRPKKTVLRLHAKEEGGG